MVAQEQIKQFNNKLNLEKKELEKSLKSFAQADPNLKGDFDSRFPEFPEPSPDQGENADEVELFENRLAVEHRLELRLKEVNEALERIQNKHYGICQKCQKSIDFKRLEANPAAKTCMDCTK